MTEQKRPVLTLKRRT
ncbi:hypothetical protein, partial [Escherichia coli]